MQDTAGHFDPIHAYGMIFICFYHSAGYDMPTSPAGVLPIICVSMRMMYSCAVCVRERIPLAALLKLLLSSLLEAKACHVGQHLFGSV